MTALRTNRDRALLAGQLLDFPSSNYALCDVDDIDKFDEQVVAWSITDQDG